MRSRLSIGIIGTRGIPNRYGGFEAFAEQMAPRLAEKGHRVTVYCSHDQHYKEPMLNGVRLRFCFNPESWLGTAGQFVYDFNCNLDSLRQPYHVILHLGYTSDSLFKGLWNKRSKHITNMDGMEWMRSKYSPKVQSYLKKAEKWAATRSDLLIADSKAIQTYLETKYATPVRFISYGAEIPASYLADIFDDFQVEPHHYDLLIARMEPENNIELAIEAKLQENSTIPLVIFGNETPYGTMLKKKYHDQSLIRFQKANYHEATLNSLRHFSRYYLHGHSVGGTNPSLLEAMASECRILAHDNPYNRTVLENNAGYYQSSAQLKELLMQPSPVEQFRQKIVNNLNSIRKNHSWDFITKEYESAFYQVLGK